MQRVRFEIVVDDVRYRKDATAIEIQLGGQIHNFQDQ